MTTVDGTSASGPVMAGLASLWNDFRLRAGMPPMGLLNPFLYKSAAADSSAFMDVTVGTNNDGDIQPKCSPFATTCPYGFQSVSEHTRNSKNDSCLCALMRFSFVGLPRLLSFSLPFPFFPEPLQVGTPSPVWDL